MSSCTMQKPICQEAEVVGTSTSNASTGNTVSKSPWNFKPVNSASAPAFEDVMSEQLAVELQLDDQMQAEKSQHDLMAQHGHSGIALLKCNNIFKLPVYIQKQLMLYRLYKLLPIITLIIIITNNL